MKLRDIFFALLVAGASAAPAHAAIQAGQNLLTNGSATDGATAGWTIITAGGNGWGAGGGGYDDTGGFFITSYALCQRSQTIDLLAKGATEAELDAAPPIRVSEAIKMDFNRSLTDTYYIRVELRDAAGAAIASWNVGTSAARVNATSSWVVDSHEFRDYGPGVRSIYFEDGGMDAGFWAGHYGTYHDAATVEFTNQPPSEIVLTPSTVGANAPAGAIVGHLTAIDTDNTTHTFSLAAEVTTATQELFPAGSNDWRYFDGGFTPAPDWADINYDDSSWFTGTAPLGYGDTWIVTPVSYGADSANKPATTWFRKSFNVTDPTSLSSLTAQLMMDDGCVAYLNGQELFRDGVAADITVTDTTLANRTVGDADESDFDPVVIPEEKLALLRTGINVIAVEVHQDKVTSSDLTLDMSLSATTNTSSNNYENALFEIVGSELRVKGGSASLSAGPHTIRVKAVDGAGNAIFKLLTVQRTTAVYAAAPTSVAVTPAVLAENVPVGSLIGNLTTADADAGQAHRFELVAGAGDTDNARVSIADTRLFTAEIPDYEERTALSVRVRVTDSAGLSFTGILSIPITDSTTEDQDGDGLTEAEEDVNNNGILDAGETNPLLADTDGDGFNDRVERNAGSDPRNPLSVPSVIELRQIATHPTNDSWLTAASWEGGLIPDSSNLAVTDNLTFRSPPTLSPVFPGVGVDLRNGAIFRMKHTGEAAIGRIILRNGILQHGMTETIGVGGTGSKLEIPTTGTIDTTGVQLDLSASLSGPGALKVIGTTAGRLRLLSPASGFTGSLSLENPEVVITDPTALNGASIIAVSAGALRTDFDTSLPDTLVQCLGSGRLVLSNAVTVGAFVGGNTIVPAGTYNVTELIALGVPPEALEDNSGTLTVTGALATRDTDGDGADDLSEIVARTDPRNPSDRLKLSSVTRIGNGVFRLAWTAVPGLTYTVQQGTGLADPWQDVIAVTPDTATGEIDLSLPLPAPARAFFRLAVK